MTYQIHWSQTAEGHLSDFTRHDCHERLERLERDALIGRFCEACSLEFRWRRHVEPGGEMPLSPHPPGPTNPITRLCDVPDSTRARLRASAPPSQVWYGWLNRGVMVARNCSDPPEPRCGGPENQAVVRPRACRFVPPREEPRQRERAR